jgi:hypothetical protein
VGSELPRASAAGGERRPGRGSWRSRLRWEAEGSVLMLMPAAVLIVVLLGALAVDQAVVFGGQRQLVTAAQRAANDAVALGVAVEDLRAEGVVRLDPVRIDRAVGAALADVDGVTVSSWERRGDVLVVRAARQVPVVFAGAIPGLERSRRVTAVATAELRRR